MLGDCSIASAPACSPTRRCRDRRCPHCAKAKGNRIGYYLNERTKGQTDFYHVILTLPDRGDGPSEQVKIAQSAFKSIRRRKAWYSAFDGGVRKIEATVKGGQFHVHLHAFVHSSSAPDRHALSEIWGELTGATVISVLSIDSDEYRRNVAFYIAKPPQKAFLTAYNLEHLEVWIQATRGRRLIAPFGSYWGKPLLPRKPASSNNRCLKSQNRFSPANARPIQTSIGEADIGLSSGAVRALLPSSASEGITDNELCISRVGNKVAVGVLPSFVRGVAEDETLNGPKGIIMDTDIDSELLGMNLSPQQKHGISFYLLGIQQALDLVEQGITPQQIREKMQHFALSLYAPKGEDN